MNNEDLIIAYYANIYMPEFKIAPDEISRKFSLEYDVRERYQSKDFVMPFGIHGEAFYKFLLENQTEGNE